MRQILCTLPKEDYYILSSKVGTFDWFIPTEWSYAQCYPFVANIRDAKILGLKPLSLKASSGKRKKMRIAPHARVIYLSPELEKIAWDRILVVVAHELAHIILNHPLYVGKERDRNEEEAWALVRKWGFNNEVRKHLAFHKRTETLYEKKIKELTQRKRQ